MDRTALVCRVLRPLFQQLPVRALSTSAAIKRGVAWSGGRRREAGQDRHGHRNPQKRGQDRFESKRLTGGKADQRPRRDNTERTPFTATHDAFGEAAGKPADRKFRSKARDRDASGEAPDVHTGRRFGSERRNRDALGGGDRSLGLRSRNRDASGEVPDLHTDRRFGGQRRNRDALGGGRDGRLVQNLGLNSRNRDAFGETSDVHPDRKLGLKSRHRDALEELPDVHTDRKAKSEKGNRDAFGKVPDVDPDRKAKSEKGNRDAFDESDRSSNLFSGPDERSRRQRDFIENTRHSKAPLSVPYTTAASQFIYGLSAVIAALRANRRKLYNLYLHHQALTNPESSVDIGYARKLALSLGVKVKEVTNEWLPLMDKMSSGRAHNGCVLEAAPLPEMNVVGLGSFSRDDGYFGLELGERSQEDAALYPTPDRINYKSQGWRYPFVLLLDGVLDPGNLGAILRSAYFLGVDAVATTVANSSPITAVALKASAGAAEALTTLRVRRPGLFLDNSTRHGWHVYAAEAPSWLGISNPGKSGGKPEDLPATVVFSPTRRAAVDAKAFTRSTGASPLARHPCILLLGSEGSGVRNSLMDRASYTVGMPIARDADEVGLDSLNVSVAAAILSAEFLSKGRGNALDVGETGDENRAGTVAQVPDEELGF